MLAARAFMMLFLYNSATSTKVLPPPVKKILRFRLIRHHQIHVFLYRYVDFMKAEAAFAVYSSCEIPLGLAYGINSTVLQCPKWILIW
jgi:hypothetical protein